MKSHEQDYGMYWSPELYLVDGLTIAMTLVDKSTAAPKVEYGVMLKDIAEVKQYFKDASDYEIYMIMDGNKKSILYKPELVVEHEMKIIIASRLRPEDCDDYYVIVDLNATNMDPGDLLEQTCELTGVDADRISVQPKYDEEGRLIRIIIYTNDKEVAEEMADDINNVDVGEGCKEGVYCLRNKKAYIKVNPRELGSAQRQQILFATVVCSVLSSIALLAF